jgi:hypothetical protein
VETYDVELTGIAPVKFNKPTAEAIKGLNPGSKAQKREDAAGREDEALQRLYMVDGQIAAPARQIKRAILDGASMGTIKIGRKGAIGYLKATVMVTDGSFGVSRARPDHRGRGPHPTAHGRARAESVADARCRLASAVSP